MKRIIAVVLCVCLLFGTAFAERVSWTAAQYEEYISELEDTLEHVKAIAFDAVLDTEKKVAEIKTELNTTQADCDILARLYVILTIEEKNDARTEKVEELFDKLSPELSEYINGEIEAAEKVADVQEHPINTPEPTVIYSETIGLDSDPEAITWLQGRLVELGWLKGTPNGIYDESTRMAVTSLQIRLNSRHSLLLDTSGIADSTTLDYINNDYNVERNPDPDRAPTLTIFDVPAMPSANPSEGSYIRSVQITLTADENAQIYFTLDGSEPNKDSLLYSSPIILYYGTYMLRAIAVINGIASDIFEAKYTIGL